MPNVGGTAPNTVLVMGGESNGVVSSTVQFFNDPSNTWSPLPPQSVSQRSVANAVLLPDASVLWLGGDAGGQMGVPQHLPVQVPKLYKSGVWTSMATETSPRLYHSTAVLLPSAEVLSAGGENFPTVGRTYDYQVFTPPYLSCPGYRPQLTAWPSTIHYGQEHGVGFPAPPPGVQIAKVVLMRPCSITHHSDMDQRYVELEDSLPVGSSGVLGLPSAPLAPLRPARLLPHVPGDEHRRALRWPVRAAGAVKPHLLPLALALAVSLALAPPPCQAQDLLWARQGVADDHGFKWPMSVLGDLDGDGYDDIVIKTRVAKPACCTGPLWFLSGRDGHTLRVRQEVAFLFTFWRVAATGDMDGDGTPDYATMIFDQSSGNSNNVVQVCSGKDDHLIWKVDELRNTEFGGTMVGNLDLDGDGNLICS